MANVKGSRQENLVLKPHRPGRVWMLVSVGLIFSAISLVASFYGGRVYEQQQQTLVPADKQKLEKFLEQSVVLENDRMVDRIALETARQNINELEGEVHRLTKDVAFYKSVLAPESEVKGLFVHDLDIEALAQAGLPDSKQYRLSWVLTQTGKNKGYLSGKVEIKFHGVSEGEKRVLSLKDVTKKMPNVAFKLRYFQIFEANIQIPENLKVEKVEVLANSKGKYAQNITREFDWVVQGGVEHVGG